MFQGGKNISFLVGLFFPYSNLQATLKPTLIYEKYGANKLIQSPFKSQLRQRHPDLFHQFNAVSSEFCVVTHSCRSSVCTLKQFRAQGKSF